MEWFIEIGINLINYLSIILLFGSVLLITFKVIEGLVWLFCRSVEFIIFRRERYHGSDE